jgi:hypothetical protein
MWVFFLLWQLSDGGYLLGSSEQCFCCCLRVKWAVFLLLFRVKWAVFLLYLWREQVYSWYNVYICACTKTESRFTYVMICFVDIGWIFWPLPFKLTLNNSRNTAHLTLKQQQKHCSLDPKQQQKHCSLDPKQQQKHCSLDPKQQQKHCSLDS